MPRKNAVHRRYMGTLYFPTLAKRESWAEYMKDLKSRQVNDSTMKFFSAVRLLYTSVQMPVKRARRYMGTLYFPTLAKRESWAEYMKDTSDFCASSVHRFTFNLCSPGTDGPHRYVRSPQPLST